MSQPPFSASLFWFALALFSAPFFLMANPARQERGIVWALGMLFLGFVPTRAPMPILAVVALFLPALCAWVWVRCGWISGTRD
jgi:hypothetical protein